VHQAEVFRGEQLVARLSRESRPYGQADAFDWPGCVLVSDGIGHQAPEPPPPPLKEIVRAQLDPDEEQRKALLRDMRSEAMAALIANGISTEHAQAAGQGFCMDYAVEIYAFEFGASKAFFELVSADERKWLSLPWPGHDGATIRDVFIGSKS
jgi:hypothetical protein